MFRSLRAVGRAYRIAAIMLLNAVVIFAVLEAGTRAYDKAGDLAQGLAARLGAASSGGPAAAPSAAVDVTSHDVILRQPWGAHYLDDERRDGGGFAIEYSPYVEWKLRPFAGSVTTVSSDGFRIVPGASDAPNAFKVFVLGGSTVMGSGAPDDGTIPAYLQSALAAKSAGRPVRVSNLGVAGWVSTQETLFLIDQLERGNVPDLVVLYDGVNDVTFTAQNLRAGVPWKYQEMVDLFRGGDELGQLFLQRSNWHVPSVFLKRYLGALRAVGLHIGFVPFIDLPEYRGSLLLYEYDAIPTERRDALARDVFDAYVRNVRIVERLAETYGFKVQFFWQPTLFTTGKRLTAEESAFLSREAFGYRDLTARVTPLVRGETQRDARITLLAAALDDAEGTVFLDQAHLLPAGNERLARAIAATIVIPR